MVNLFIKKFSFSPSTNFPINDLIDGSIRKSPNAADVCTIYLNNKNGKNNYRFKYGEKIWFKFGWEGYYYPKPIFVGYVWNKQIDAQGGKIRFDFYSCSSILEKEKIYITDYDNYDGYEALSAIYAIGLKYGVTVVAQGSWVESTKNIFIPSTLRSDGKSALDIIKEILNLCIDVGNYPNKPAVYYFIDETDDSGNDYMVIRKEIVKNDDNPVNIDPYIAKTFTIGKDIFLNNSRDEITDTVTGYRIADKDGNLLYEYSNASAKQWRGIDNVPSVTTELTQILDAQEMAVRLTELNKRIRPSGNLTVRDAFWLRPFDWIKIVGQTDKPEFGTTDTYRIYDINYNFGKDITTELNIGNSIPYLSTWMQ